MVKRKCVKQKCKKTKLDVGVCKSILASKLNLGVCIETPFQNLLQKMSLNF